MNVGRIIFLEDNLAQHRPIFIKKNKIENLTPCHFFKPCLHPLLQNEFISYHNTYCICHDLPVMGYDLFIHNPSLRFIFRQHKYKSKI